MKQILAPSTIVPPAARVCPRCGHRDRTSAFPVTRDTRTAYVRDSEEYRKVLAAAHLDTDAARLASV